MPLRDTNPDRYRTNPQEVSVIEHTRIPLSDGTELAARIWMPACAADSPVPAVLEYLPYGKNHMTAPRDQTIHPEFAKAGYASIRVDMRGSGDSDGVMADEYAESELADGVEVLAWIGQQSWSSGRVGIIGKSWGGFNGLQIAARRPPELATIITVCSTDDRYADDVHYNGGAIIGSEMLSWASTMFAYNARPADPKVVGDRWRDDWFTRIDQTPINAEDWLSHQRRDDYWKHGSVCEDYTDINVPVFAVGGLLDEYRTTLFRLMENASAPVHSLLGPWAHNYPHQAAPGPGIDFIAEAIRWWDHWMYDVDNDVETQPQIRAYVPESCPVGTDIETRPGRWVSEQQWPTPQVPTEDYSATHAEVAGPTVLSSTEMIGYSAGSWLQFGAAAGQPLDQSADDAKSYTASWDVGEADLETLGTPTVTLTARSSTDRGVLAVRLNDVSPEGESKLLTMGLINLTHHASHETPAPLSPGEPVTVTVPLLSTAHRFAAGHKIRISISASFWPILWPTGKDTDITIDSEPVLHLPVRQTTDDEFTQAEFRPAPTPPAMPYEFGDTPMRRRLSADLVSGEVTVTTSTDDWQQNTTDGLYYFTSEEDSYQRRADDPTSPLAECRRSVKFHRPAGDMSASESGILGSASLAGEDWDVELRTLSRMFGDETTFTVTNELIALENGRQVRTRSSSRIIPRDLN